MTDRQSSLDSFTSHRQPAQALALAGLLLGLVLLPLIGLAVDVEIVFSAHRRLEMLAGSALRRFGTKRRLAREQLVQHRPE